MTNLHITSAFDGGNIIVHDAKDSANIRLAIRPDNNSSFFQWFYYRVTGGKGQALKMVMENAKDSVYYAYFAPYPMDRHADIVAEAALQEGVSLRVLGQTVQGQDMDCLSVGTGEKTIWVIARQHPGETMAEWWMEGFLSRLLDTDDDVSMALRKKATFHIIPNMCPDGGKNGNLRTNETGANLNREWGVATIQSAPEVYHTIKAMDAAHAYDCLAMTLEMPFKDNANAPDAQFGWSPDRSADLGAAVLDAMLAVVDEL